MRHTIPLLVIAGLFCSLSTLARPDALECEKIRQRISKIESKMRAGYTRAQGERMAAELRRLRALRAKACR